jgi:hypothetical protein
MPVDAACSLAASPVGCIRSNPRHTYRNTRRLIPRGGVILFNRRRARTLTTTSLRPSHRIGGIAEWCQSLVGFRGFVVTDIDSLFGLIPVGEKNAETSIQIWKRLDLWAPTTVRYKLNCLVVEGRIKRIVRPSHKGGEAHFYYRLSITGEEE